MATRDLIVPRTGAIQGAALVAPVSADHGVRAGIVAVPLSRLQPRQGRYATHWRRRFLVYFVYFTHHRPIVAGILPRSIHTFRSTAGWK